MPKHENKKELDSLNNSLKPTIRLLAASENNYYEQ